MSIRNHPEAPTTLAQITTWIPRILLTTLLLAGMMFLLTTDLSIERILEASPQNALLAALALILAYCVVSVFFVFPLVLFYIVAGLLFPPGIALLLNTIGIAGNITLPFLFSQHSGKNKVMSMLQQHPRLALINAKFSHNPWFFAFILRAINLLPVTGVSLFMGVTDIRYRTYLSGTLCGMVPAMIPITLMGDAVRDPSSPQFFLSIGLVIVMTIIPVILYKVISKKTNEQENESAIHSSGVSGTR